MIFWRYRGRSGFSSPTGCAGRCIRLIMTSKGVAPVKGTTPAAIWYRITPRA